MNVEWNWFGGGGVGWKVRERNLERNPDMTTVVHFEHPMCRMCMTVASWDAHMTTVVHFEHPMFRMCMTVASWDAQMTTVVHFEHPVPQKLQERNLERNFERN